MHFGYYIAISLRHLCLFSNYDFNENLFHITISFTMFIFAIHHMFKLGLLFLQYFDFCLFSSYRFVFIHRVLIACIFLLHVLRFSIKSVFVIIFVAIMNLLVTAMLFLFSNDRRQN